MLDEGEKSIPIVTYLFLVFTISIQVYLNLLPTNKAIIFYDTFSLTPIDFFYGTNFNSLISYIFVHGSFLHLFINCIALYGAGTIVEREIGHIKFFITFLVSGMISGFFHSFLNAESSIPLVGSSGAIFGVIAILFLLMPFKFTFALILPLPSVVVGIILCAIEISALYMANDVGIAHDTHIVGFIIGGILAFLIDKKRALKGLLIAVVILLLIYGLNLYLNLFSSLG